MSSMVSLPKRRTGMCKIGYGEGISNEEDWGLSEENWGF